MIKKAVDAKAKLALCSRSSTKEIDQYYPQGNQLANFTKSQGNIMKDPRSEKPKVQEIESLSGPQRSKSSKKARKEKKKEQRQKN